MSDLKSTGPGRCRKISPPQHRQKKPSSKSSSDNWSIAIYKTLSLKKSRFGDGVVYLVDNIEPKSKYRGTKTGLDRTQIQRVDPTTVMASGRTITDEDKILNIKAEAPSPKATKPATRSATKEKPVAKPAPPKVNKVVTQKDWTAALKGVIYKGGGDKFEVTKVYIGLPPGGTDKGDYGWHVLYFNVNKTKAEHYQTFEEMLNTGRDTKQK